MVENVSNKHIKTNRTMNISAIKDLGFRVFIRKGGDSYAYFSDGKSIGYIQEDRCGYSVTTVHAPNRTTGTGYRMAEFSEITKENLLPAFAFAPEWALQRDRDTVQKYASIPQFLKANSWGGGLEEVQ